MLLKLNITFITSRRQRSYLQYWQMAYFHATKTSFAHDQTAELTHYLSCQGFLRFLKFRH